MKFLPVPKNILSFFFLVLPYQGRNMVYPGPTDPYFLAVILIPEPLFPQNFDPRALIKTWSHPCFTQNFNLDNFVYLQI